MPKRERSARLTGEFSSVGEMIRATGEDPAFADEFEQRSASRRFIDALIRLRGIKGLSQKDVADKLGCTQGRVSKMENSADAAIAFGDLLAYASALGYGLEITLMPKQAKAVDRVKFHAMHIKKLVNRLAGLAARDPAIAAGVSQFFGEAAFHFLLILQEAADRLPKTAQDEKEATVDVEVCGPAGLENLPPAPKRVRKRRPEKVLVGAK